MIDLTDKENLTLKPKHPRLLLAITTHGVALAKSIHKDLQADLFYPEKFLVSRDATGDSAGVDAGVSAGGIIGDTTSDITDDTSVFVYRGNVKVLLEIAFGLYKEIIAIVSIGALVRLMAPLLKDKKTDPAVVVLDEKSKYAISVLSGHIGGANELAKEVAAISGAEAVITTASDVNRTLAVDILGKKFGWVVEQSSALTPASASVVNEEPVALIQESGETNWWNFDKKLPENIHVYHSINDLTTNDYKSTLWITHRDLSSGEKQQIENTVVYHPRVIVLGIGCNRGTATEEIESVIIETLKEQQLSFDSVLAICTIDIKKDEQGLIDVCKMHNWPLSFYSAKELNTMDIESPSETVFKYTGAYGVSEPAAKLFSANNKLIVTKKKSGNVTISVGLIATEGFYKPNYE